MYLNRLDQLEEKSKIYFCDQVNLIAIYASNGKYVSEFGKKGKVWCKDNQPIESPDSKVLSCNKKNPNSGNTKVEFNMNFKPSDYISFQMFNSKFGERMKSSEYFEFWRGSCEEIKF